jgi:DNA-binding transcriptional LysR family regulator
VIGGALEGIAAHAGHLRGMNQTGEVVFLSQLCEAYYWVMPRLSGFHQRYPEIEIRVVASTKPLTEAGGRFDVALQTSSRASGSHPLVFTVPDEVFPLCSPAYLAGRKLPLDLADLSNHHLLHHKAYPQDWIEWDGWLERLGLDLRVGHRGSVYDSYPVMIQAAVEGHGITLGWRRTMEKLVGTGVLVRPFDESVILLDGLSVYRCHGARSRPEAEALIAWLKSQLSP